MSIAENIQKLKNEIPADVTLVAVSKTKSNEEILEAYETGHRDFGENYVQELLSKHEQLPKDIRWHFIGHLQSNKVKHIAPFVHLIHGVDSFKLLKEINKQAIKNNRTMDCLLQIHIAKEETKFGMDENELSSVLTSYELMQMKNICIKGVMAMASNTEDHALIQQEFLQAKNAFSLLKNHSEKNPGPIHPEILSTGMSSDYKIALEEGSTLVRIGSLIFGERKYISKII